MNAIFTHNLALSLTCSFSTAPGLDGLPIASNIFSCMNTATPLAQSNQSQTLISTNTDRCFQNALPIHTYYQQLHTSKIAMAFSSSSRPPCIRGGYLLCLYQHSPETEQKWPKCRRVFRSLLGFLCKTRDFCNPHNNFFFPAADYGSHKETTNNQSITHTHEQPGLRTENPNSDNSGDTLCMPNTVLIIIVRVSKDVSSSVHTVYVSCSVKMAGLNI